MEKISEQDWNTWYDKVFGFFYRRVNVREDVEDLTVSTLEDFFLSEKEIHNPNAFLWGIAKNKLKEFIRKKTKSSFVNLEDLSAFESPKDFSKNYFDLIYRLKNCAKKQLKEVDREIIDLCVLCDFNSQEVAEKLSLTSGNVRQRLSRGLKKIREKCRELWLRDF